jgi:SAM-dependent methyltransferase
MRDESRLSTRQFWEARAQAFARGDEEGWAAVCHRGAPRYANRFVDWSQRRIFSRLLAAAVYARGDVALDIGCGTGRWTRVLAAAGLQAGGLDVSMSMVARAGEISPGLPFGVASATSLPVAGASVQVAASVTVLHHLEYDEQELAVAELARVIRRGGSVLAVVLLGRLPGGAWCYPRSRRGWLGLFGRHGFQPVLVLGEEYLSPGIVFGAVANAAARLRRGASAPGDPSAVAGAGAGGLLLRGVHRLAIAVSYPVEGALQHLPCTFGATGLAVTFARR